MSRREGSNHTATRRIVLLAGQAFALGLTMAWILVPASAIFLDTYGSGLLPVTYIGAALAGIASSIVLAAAFRRRPLVWVATRVLAGLSLSLAASWLLLWRTNAEWLSFGLLVLVPIVVPVGFIFVVGQAGMLLDVRILKALYARVIAGFALGFVAGGVAGPPLLAAIGSTEHLLAAAAVAAALFLVLVLVTRRSFPTELSTVEHDEPNVERPTLRVLLRHRYITLIVAFQMLSAVESQWLDFLVFDRAAQRYDNSEELARFISKFTAIAYGVDIVFLLLFAGLLLRRFGLRYGLTANPAAVLTLIGAIVVAASLQGSGVTIVFVLIVAARVTDLVFSDATSRTSLSAAYQVVPTSLRLAAQATVEGLGVPVAIGFSGVVLLVLRWTGGTDGLLLPMLTSLVVIAWTVVAVLVYRGYRVNLLAALRRRALDPAELTIDGANTLMVIERLVDSEDERDVRLALETLTIAGHPDLSARLQQLTTDSRVNVRADALERLVRLDVHAASQAALASLHDPSPKMRAISARALGGGGDQLDLAGVVGLMDDESPDVRVAAASVLVGIGDGAMRQQVATEISLLARSASAAGRIVAARMLGECEPGSWMDRAVLAALLRDSDIHVVGAALDAVRWPDDADLMVDVAGHLRNRRTAAAAVDALVRGGEDVLDFVDRALRDHTFGRRGQELLVRVCREMGGSAAAAVLRQHVEHPDREVGLAVLIALAALDPSGTGATTKTAGSEHAERGEPVESSIVRADLEHATHVLRALIALEQHPSATLLRAALRDELELVRQRVLAGLAIRHGREGVNQVAFQFQQRDARAHALALEWLDVTLGGTDRAAVAMLEPGLSDIERLRALSRRFPIAESSPNDALRELLEDRDARWRRPWLHACAIHAASGWSGDGLDAMGAAAMSRWTFLGDPADGDIVHETLTAIRRRHGFGDGPVESEQSSPERVISDTL